MRSLPKIENPISVVDIKILSFRQKSHDTFYTRIKQCTYIEEENQGKILNWSQVQ